MTDSSSKLLQIQGTWHQERKPTKNPKPEPKKTKNYSAPFVLAKNGRFRMKESTDHQTDTSIQMLNCNELQMFSLQESLALSYRNEWTCACRCWFYMFLFHLDLAGGGYLPRLEPGKPVVQSKRLQTSWNPVSTTFFSAPNIIISHHPTAFFWVYIYQLQKALSQPIRRHGKRQSVAALGSLAWCGVLSSHPTVTGRIPWLIDHQGSWWWAFYFVVIEAFLVSPGKKNERKPIFESGIGETRLDRCHCLAQSWPALRPSHRTGPQMGMGQHQWNYHMTGEQSIHQGISG